MSGVLSRDRAFCSYICEYFFTFEQKGCTQFECEFLRNDAGQAGGCVYRAENKQAVISTLAVAEKL